jgi:lipopolysaccharide/colanic/teichoic acid biosynthesis glycosyltransferase
MMIQSISAKRLFDIFFASVGLLVLMFPFAAIALWIRLDSPGSIFFRQTRIGQFGKEFQIYKFRTMVQNAETLGKQITVGEDPRITRSGQFLRKYKLDELPQLINVFKGEMSFVGARPEVPRYVALYSPEQFEVLNMPPGITDLASIQFRNESDLLAQVANPEEFYIQQIMPKKLELNRQYVAQSGLRTDIKIILSTIYNLTFDKQTTPSL